jgi:hypothetical protein
MMKRFLLVLLLLLVALPASAQRRGGRGNMYGMLGDANSFYTPPDFNGNAKYDGRFVFARIKYRGFQCFGDQGPGWAHDYPRAESHFMRIMKTVSSMRPFIVQGPVVGGNIVALDDPELFKYPVGYLSEPGGWAPNASEVTALRNYLTKGGFLIVDDFEENCTQGGDSVNFTAVMKQVLPSARLQPIPPDHPIFDSFYKINFQAFGGGGGRGRGFGGGFSGPRWYGIFQDNDPKKRLMVVANYLLDMGELMEYSDQGFNVVPTNEAYKLGVNYLIYALTH